MLGFDLVGVVETVGPGVEAVVVGDRVVAITRWGANANAVLVPVEKLTRIDSDVDSPLVEPMVLTGATAAAMVRRLAAVTAGQTVYVQGGSGGSVSSRSRPPCSPAPASSRRHRPRSTTRCADSAQRSSTTTTRLSPTASALSLPTAWTSYWTSWCQPPRPRRARTAVRRPTVQPSLFVDLGEPDEPAPAPDDAPEPLSLVQAEGLVRALLELPPGA